MRVLVQNSHACGQIKVVAVREQPHGSVDFFPGEDPSQIEVHRHRTLHVTPVKRHARRPIHGEVRSAITFRAHVAPSTTPRNLSFQGVAAQVHEPAVMVDLSDVCRVSGEHGELVSRIRPICDNDLVPMRLEVHVRIHAQAEIIFVFVLEQRRRHATLVCRPLASGRSDHPRVHFAQEPRPAIGLIAAAQQNTGHTKLFGDRFLE
mmetsp:Transcript_13834/g.37552  ORF Transcript_13834/g.37552 Transcript_13834/m.37552 type:complete len:205 (+) Transcript_13834:479-1093(+)